MGTVAELLPWTLAFLRYSVLERNCLYSHDVMMMSLFWCTVCAAERVVVPARAAAEGGLPTGPGG